MAGGTTLERLSDDLRNAGAHTEADILLGLRTGFARVEREEPGIRIATIKALEEMFGGSLGISDINRFPLRTRRALINSGKIILTPGGKTIPEIVAEGLDVKPMPIEKEVVQGNEVFTQASLRSEVAVDPRHYIVASSVGLPPEDQDRELARYKTEVETQFPGATVIKGDAATHVHLALIKFRRDGRDFHRNQPEWARVQTSSQWTPYLRRSVALISPLNPDLVRNLNIWVQPLEPSTFDRSDLVRVGIAPLIVPTYHPGR